MGAGKPSRAILPARKRICPAALRGLWRRDDFQREDLLLDLAIAADPNDQGQGIGGDSEPRRHRFGLNRFTWWQGYFFRLDDEITEVGIEIQHLDIDGLAAVIGEPQLEPDRRLVARDDVRSGIGVTSRGTPSRRRFTALPRPATPLASPAAAVSGASTTSAVATAVSAPLLAVTARTEAAAAQQHFGFELTCEEIAMGGHFGGRGRGGRRRTFFGGGRSSAGMAFGFARGERK